MKLFCSCGICELKHVLYLVEDVRQRWKALRDRYVRETRKQKQPSGSATKSIPPWELVQSMRFLNDFVKHRKLVSLLLLLLLLFSFKTNLNAFILGQHPMLNVPKTEAVVGALPSTEKQCESHSDACLCT